MFYYLYGDAYDGIIYTLLCFQLLTKKMPFIHHCQTFEWVIVEETRVSSSLSQHNFTSNEIQIIET